MSFVSFENILMMLSMMAALCVVLVSNPVQALMSLILCFGLASLFFMYMGIEFVSLLIFMVYLGAIAVLFLFVIMMLNMKMVELSTYYWTFMPIGGFIVFVFFLELCFFLFMDYYYEFMINFDFVFKIDMYMYCMDDFDMYVNVPSLMFFWFKSFDFLTINWFNLINLDDNMFLLSILLYNYYSILLYCLTLILLMSMIGSIILVMNWENNNNKVMFKNVYFYGNKSIVFLE